MGEKVLVTGAGGFIGSHLTEMLVHSGHDVRAFVHYNSVGSWGWLDTSEIADAVEILSGDIRDPSCVRGAMQGCGSVLHLAALIGIPYSYRSPASYVDTNVKGTLNVVQAACDLGVGHVVHTSTSEVYGTAQFVPITENHPVQGQSPYSASKIGADQIAFSYYASFGLPVTILRPFNTYGPRQSTRAIIPTVIAQIVDGSRRLRLGALHPTRDFNFVTDTAAAFVAALDSEGGVGEVVNIGSDFEVSIGDTVKVIADVMEVEVEVETDDARMRPERSEVERLWASNGKARELLGWTPAYGGSNGFRRGIGETVAWFSEPLNQSGLRSDRYVV